MGNAKKVVLAYSCGLDTSIIIPWLKEHYWGETGLLDSVSSVSVCLGRGYKPDEHIPFPGDAVAAIDRRGVRFRGFQNIALK